MYANPDTKPKRHIGKIKNTDQRCVVVFMQLPGREDHALVLPTDNMPARYEQAVMEILESQEGQAEETLADALNRRILPETGQTVLAALHLNKMLEAVPVDNVLMMPRPNMPFPLRQVLTGMGRPIPDTSHTTLAETQKFNPHEANRKTATVRESAGIANNLLAEAADLEAEARRKRERAYQYAPHLAPVTGAAPEATVASVKPVRETADKPKVPRKPRVAKGKAA